MCVFVLLLIINQTNSINSINNNIGINNRVINIKVNNNLIDDNNADNIIIDTTTSVKHMHARITNNTFNMRYDEVILFITMIIFIILVRLVLFKPAILLIGSLYINCTDNISIFLFMLLMII